MSHYDRLGVSRSASMAEIKSAFRKRAMQWHPDRNKSPNAAAQFRELSEAYQTLINPSTRFQYDAEIKAAESTTSRPEPPPRSEQRKEAPPLPSAKSELDAARAAQMDALLAEVDARLSVTSEQLSTLFGQIDRMINGALGKR